MWWIRAAKNYMLKKEQYQVPGISGLMEILLLGLALLSKTLIKKIIFIADSENRVNEIVTRFSRVGYDNTMGYLEGGMSNWKSHGFEVDTIGSMSAHLVCRKIGEG